MPTDPTSHDLLVASIVRRLKQARQQEADVSGGWTIGNADYLRGEIAAYEEVLKMLAFPVPPPSARRPR